MSRRNTPLLIASGSAAAGRAGRANASRSKQRKGLRIFGTRLIEQASSEADSRWQCRGRSRSETGVVARLGRGPLVVAHLAAAENGRPAVNRGTGFQRAALRAPIRVRLQGWASG